MMDNISDNLIISSYNCRGFNSTKSRYIASFLSKCNILFLQEHWLADAQLNVLGNISTDIAYTGISGFGSSDVLSGRPFGGCAILWESNLFANVRPVDINSRRACAVRVSFESFELLLINVYMPYEDSDEKTDEFINTLALIEDAVANNSDCHIILGGDFNVDFCRNWSHTALLNSFCDDAGLLPTIRHSACTIDYTYNFNMDRFSILDHFVVSGTLFDECILGVSVLHDVDNISDHDPILLNVSIDCKFIATCERVFTPRASWVKSSVNDLENYRSALSLNLKAINLPASMLLCTDMGCKDDSHHNAINQYSEAITSACITAAEAHIPKTSDRHSDHTRVPGWTERVEPFRQKSLFWHGIWVDCGRPRNGVVADCMRRTRAQYHYTVRQVKRDEESIVRERIAEALIVDPTRSFWVEVKKIRNNKASGSKIVDGRTDETSIAQLFADKYRNLYSSVPFDAAEMQLLLTELDARVNDGGLSKADHIFTTDDILVAIDRLNSHKNDGNSSGLSTDHFLNAGSDLSTHTAFLFTAMVIHGSAPRAFGASTIIPIPKKHNINVADSNNFRGIALSSIFCKVFDNVILDKFHKHLCTSDLQFGFKSKSSTNMCTMVLKETISHYVKNQSSVYCTFLDASKAFDRVHYSKLFRLLVKRGLPACIIRILISLYTDNQVRVLWAGLTSDYFTTLNGVKQGGVLSPILFCVYIDDLLVRLSLTGAGCYIGLHFTGALAYADDIVLLAPSPSAMRHLLAICDSYAADFDIVFNADKSKFLVIVPNKRRQLYNDMRGCIFVVGGTSIENVSKYSHLGHIVTSSFSDDDDINNRRNCFVGQVNNVICFFGKLDLTSRLKLFRSYCSSMYGCELWKLDSVNIQIFCVAWRKALRRILDLPNNTHSFLLPFLSYTLPVLDELYKRSARFIISSLFSANDVVRSVAWHSVVHAKYNSLLGSNVLTCCNRFGWNFDSFVARLVILNNNYFEQFYIDNLLDTELNSAAFLLELIMLREGHLFLTNGNFSRTQITDIIKVVATD